MLCTILFRVSPLANREDTLNEAAQLSGDFQPTDHDPVMFPIPVYFVGGRWIFLFPDHFQKAVDLGHTHLLGVAAADVLADIVRLSVEGGRRRRL